MKEDNPLLSPSSSGSSGRSSDKRTTLSFVSSQFSVSWTLALFCAITCLFFIVFFLLIVNTARAANVLVYVVAFTAYMSLAAASVWILIWFSRGDEPNNYQRSSPWIFVLCAIRGTEYMTMVVISSDNSTLESVEALTGAWGFFLCLAVVNAIVREYFGEALDESDPVSRLSQISPERLRTPTSAHRQSKGFVFSRPPDRGLTREEAQKVQERIRKSPFPESNVKTNVTASSDLYLKAIFGCCIVLTILVLLPPENPWVVVFVQLSTGVTIALSFLLIRLLISYVNILEVGSTSNSDGYFLFARTHSNGLVVMTLLFAMAARIILDGVELISGIDLLHYQPNVNATGFLNFAKETTTEVFPLFLHFYNIICMKYERTSNTPLRLKWLLYALILHLHLVIVAYIIEITPSVAFGVLLASTAGYLAAFDTALLVLIIVAPVFHLFFPIFNFGIIREAIHNMHLHRRLAYSTCFFAFVHVVVHIITWAARPHASVDGRLIYSLSSPYLYTGILMSIGYVGAVISGRQPNTHFAYHIPFTVLTVFGFSVHGSNAVLGQPTGDYIVLGTTLVSTVLMSLFFAFHPTRRAEINLLQSACVRGVLGGGRRSFFLLLVLENPTRQPVPPGSLFNIYDKRGAGYSFIHSHPFPVFSSSAKRLVFFIQCRDRKNKIRPSFTRTLYKNINNGTYKNLQLQGPLCGSSTVSASFIQYLVGLPNQTDIYFCGVDSGFSNVFSLLEHFRGNCHMYNVRAIYCVYYITEEKVRQHIHEYVDELIETWNSSGEAPISIIESNGILEALQTFSANSRAVIANAKRNDGDSVILDLWRQKFDQRSDSSETTESEVAKWIAVGKDGVEKKSNGWDGEGVEWEEVDGEGVRKKGKSKEKAEPVSAEDTQQSSKVLYSCGVDLDYKFFSESWKIFNELTSPTYQLRNSPLEVEQLQDKPPQPPIQPDTLYQASVNQ